MSFALQSWLFNPGFAGTWHGSIRGDFGMHDIVKMLRERFSELRVDD